MKVCPFKKNTTYIDAYGSRGKRENAVKIEVNFGKCDEYNCAAWHGGECKLCREK